jgi:hypothetical protein
MSHFKTTFTLLMLTLCVPAIAQEAGDSTSSGGGTPIIHMISPPTRTIPNKKKSGTNSNANQNPMQNMFNSLGGQGNGATNPLNSGAASATGGGGLGRTDSAAGVRGDCRIPVDNGMLSDFRTCMNAKAAPTARDKTCMIVNMDKGVGYLLDKSGRLDCFTITIGSRGQGTGENQTEPGLFFTKVQNGAKYQTGNSDWERKGISMDIGGKIIHSDHRNPATAGCIGVQQDKWQHVFNTLGTDNAPVYVWGKAHTGCDRGNNIPQGPSIGTPSAQ